MTTTLRFHITESGLIGAHTTDSQGVRQSWQSQLVYKSLAEAAVGVYVPPGFALDPVIDPAWISTQKQPKKDIPAEVIGYCVVIVDGCPEVLRMRISHAGNLVDTGGHYRWPAGMLSLGDDPTTWPTIHPMESTANAELYAIHDACKHTWAIESHEEDRCTGCGAWRFVPDL